MAYPAQPPGQLQEFFIHLRSPAEAQNLGLKFRIKGDAPGAGRMVCDEVDEGSPFDRAGVRAGDIVHAFDGVEVTDRETVLSVVADIRQSNRSGFSVAVLRPDTPPPQSQASVNGSLGAAPASQRALRRAGMPLFEPSHDSTASGLMRQAAQKAAPGDDDDTGSFSFPADEAFWDNFVVQMRLDDAAHQEPVFDVQASHDSRVHQVNQAWMRSFVAGWEMANPHVVTVRSQGGSRAFYASDDFWKTVVMGLDPADDGADAVLVESSLLPDQQPVRTSAAAWNTACERWDESKGCTAEHRREHMARRQAEADDAELRREARRKADEDRAAAAHSSRSQQTQPAPLALTRRSSNYSRTSTGRLLAGAPQRGAAAQQQQQRQQQQQQPEGLITQTDIAALSARVEELERENRKAQSDIERLRRAASGDAARGPVALQEWERRLGQREQLILAAESRMLQKGPDEAAQTAHARRALTPAQTPPPQQQQQQQQQHARPAAPRQLPSLSPPRPVRGGGGQLPYELQQQQQQQQQCAAARQYQQPSAALRPQHGSPRVRLQIDVTRDGAAAGPPAAFDFEECWRSI